MIASADLECRRDRGSIARVVWPPSNALRHRPTHNWQARDRNRDLATRKKIAGTHNRIIDKHNQNTAQAQTNLFTKP